MLQTRIQMKEKLLLIRMIIHISNRKSLWCVFNDGNTTVKPKEKNSCTSIRCHANG